jgi:hypothetical protein
MNRGRRTKPRKKIAETHRGAALRGLGKRARGSAGLRTCSLLCYVHKEAHQFSAGTSIQHSRDSFRKARHDGTQGVRSSGPTPKETRNSRRGFAEVLDSNSRSFCLVIFHRLLSLLVRLGSQPGEHNSAPGLPLLPGGEAPTSSSPSEVSQTPQYRLAEGTS